MRAANSSRRLRLASVSRSTAWSDFFQPQPQPLQQMPYPSKTERNAGIAVQLHLQLSQRQIRLRGHPVHYLMLCLDTGPQFTARVVRNPLGLASAVPLRRNFLGPAQAHQEAIRKLLQRLLALIVGQQKLTAQVISIWLRH